MPQLLPGRLLRGRWTATQDALPHLVGKTGSFSAVVDLGTGAGCDIRGMQGEVRPGVDELYSTVSSEAATALLSMRIISTSSSSDLGVASASPAGTARAGWARPGL